MAWTQQVGCEAVSGLDQALTAALEAVSATAQSAAELARLLDRIKALQSTWSRLAPGGPSPVDATSVRWMEWGVDRSWRMVRAPLDSAARFSRLVQEAGSGTKLDLRVGHPGSLTTR